MTYSRRSSIVTACIAVLLVSLMFATSVPAVSVHDIPFTLGESPTNPPRLGDPHPYPGTGVGSGLWYNEGDPLTNWRNGWGNSTTVHYILRLPRTDWITEGHVRHVHYRFDRNVGERYPVVVPGGARVDMSTVFVGADSIEVRKDIVSHWLQESAAAWGYVPVPGQRHPFEGLWSFSYRFEADGRHGGESILASHTIGPTILGIDVTPPLRVEKLTAKPAERYTGPTGLWTESQQAFVYWEDRDYDALSGTAYFEVQVNGVTRGKPVFYLPPTRPYVTLHDMPPGKSTIRVRAVDRATNPGPWATTHFYSDPDEPQLSISRPARDGALVGRRYTFVANPVDRAGIRWVRFEIDGVPVGTDTVAPYRLELDMSRFANGPRTLTVTAADMLGREVTQTRRFILDNVMPTVSNVTDGPDPFFPLIRDGNRDWMAVRFHVSENVRAYLHVYDRENNLIATRSAPRRAGATSLTWDGKGDEAGAEAIGPGTYTYRLRVIDPAGNTTWWGRGSTTIRDFEIVRVGPHAVRIVPR